MAADPLPQWRVTDANAADHLAIAQVTHAFHMTLDARDFDGHAATCAPDMRFEGDFGTHEGRDAYMAYARAFAGGASASDGMRHFLSNAMVEIDGDRARQVVCLMVVRRRGPAGLPELVSTARFDDVLARLPEGWRFLSRRISVDQDVGLFR